MKTHRIPVLSVLLYSLAGLLRTRFMALLAAGVPIKLILLNDNQISRAVAHKVKRIIRRPSVPPVILNLCWRSDRTDQDVLQCLTESFTH